MDRTTFDKINQYCDSKNVSQIERDFVFYRFAETLFNSILQKELQKGSSLSAKEIKDIQDPLLNDMSLDNIIGNAKTYHLKVEDRFYRQFERNSRKHNFWSSVWTNIVANIIYSALLILSFWLGKDLITGWLTSLLNN